uniref:Uncharacterized protein n=1 Tax=Hydrogenovibrio crunogenus (strain DSM 25203 / XCL-2) TaxID=317025 RepID=Q31HT3_HYDCU
MKSEEWTDWYLTESGWHKGSHKIDLHNEVSVNEPSDWVYAGRYLELQRGMSLQKVVMEQRYAEGHSKETVADLIEEFGDVPHSL